MKQLKPVSLLVFGLSALFYIFFDFCKHAPILGAANPFAEDPYDAVGSFGIQLAFFTAFLMLVRVFHPYSKSGIPSFQITLALRSGMVVVLSIAVTLAADAIGLARAVFMDGVFSSAWRLAGLIAGMTLLTLAAGWALLRVAHRLIIPFERNSCGLSGIILGLAILSLAFYPLAWRNSSLLGALFSAFTGMVLLFIPVWRLATVILPTGGLKYEDLLDDLAAIFQSVLPHSTHVEWVNLRIKKLAALSLVLWVIHWLNPRRYPWRLVVLTSAAMGLLLLLAETMAEGIAPDPGKALLVMGVYIGMEGLGVALGYFLFGTYLGIYRLE